METDEAQPMPFVSECCQGERCHCGEPAAHKVEEILFDDEPIQSRQPLSAYICHAHFLEIMGNVADEGITSGQKKTKGAA